MVAIWHDGYRRNIVVVAWKHKPGLILQLKHYNYLSVVAAVGTVLTMHCSDALKPLKVPQLDAHIS